MASALNKAIPQFREVYDDQGFYVKDGRPINFFVYDLVDTTTNSYPAKLPIELSENGVYHFSPVRYSISFSHIAVVVDGKMKIFSFLNCEGGDKIEDVIQYVERNLPFDGILTNRIRKYRSHGIYGKTDPQTKLKCP